MDVNFGDIIFQLLTLLIAIIFILLIFSVSRSVKRNREQLNRIEAKLDAISNEKNK